MSEGLDANSLKARHAPAASFLSVRALMTGERSMLLKPSLAVAVANSAAAEASIELAKKAADIAVQFKEHVEP